MTYGHTKQQAKDIIDVVSQAVMDELYCTGSVTFGSWGKFSLVNKPEKKGVSKFSGTEKEWVVPAHLEVGFRESQNAVRLINTIGNPDYLKNRDIAPWDKEYPKPL